MKSCTLCGAEYSERISFCFNDGEVLVQVQLSRPAPEDPFDVPMPGNMPVAMPSEDVAETPVPVEAREDGIVARQHSQVAEPGNVLPPPAPAEPNDFTPRPLEPMSVGPKDAGRPVYTPPVGVDVEEVTEFEEVEETPAVIPAPTPPAGEPSAPPPRRTPTPPPSQKGGNNNGMFALVIAAVVVIGCLLFFGVVLVVGSTSSTGGADPEPEPVAVAPAPVPAPVIQPPPDVEPEPAPEDDELPEAPGAVDPEPFDLGTVEGSPEPEVTPVVPAPGPEPTQPEPPAEPETPWGVVPEPPVVPQPTPEPVAAPEPAVRRVAFSSSPSGAELVINGEQRGATPLTQALEDGEYEVSMRMAGYVSQRRTLVVDGSTTAMRVDLPKIAEASLTVTAPGLNGGTLFIDGTPVGTVPRQVTVKPGQHTFTVELPDQPKKSVTKDIAMEDTSVIIE